MDQASKPVGKVTSYPATPVAGESESKPQTITRKKGRFTVKQIISPAGSTDNNGNSNFGGSHKNLANYLGEKQGVSTPPSITNANFASQPSSESAFNANANGTPAAVAISQEAGQYDKDKEKNINVARDKTTNRSLSRPSSPPVTNSSSKSMTSSKEKDKEKDSVNIEGSLSLQRSNSDTSTAANSNAPPKKSRFTVKTVSKEGDDTKDDKDKKGKPETPTHSRQSTPPRVVKPFPSIGNTASQNEIVDKLQYIFEMNNHMLQSMLVAFPNPNSVSNQSIHYAHHRGINNGNRAYQGSNVSNFQPPGHSFQGNQQTLGDGATGKSSVGSKSSGNNSSNSNTNFSNSGILQHVASKGNQMISANINDVNVNVSNNNNCSSDYCNDSSHLKSAYKLQYLLSEMSKEIDAQRGFDNSAEIKALKERCQLLDERLQAEIIKNANAQETIRQLQGQIEEQQATIMSQKQINLTQQVNAVMAQSDQQNVNNILNTQNNVNQMSGVSSMGQINPNVYSTTMSSHLNTALPLIQSMSNNYSQPTNQGYSDALGGMTTQQQQQQQQMYHQQWGGNQNTPSIQPVNSQPTSQQQQQHFQHQQPLQQQMAQPALQQQLNHSIQQIQQQLQIQSGFNDINKQSTGMTKSASRDNVNVNIQGSNPQNPNQSLRAMRISRDGDESNSYGAMSGGHLNSSVSVSQQQSINNVQQQNGQQNPLQPMSQQNLNDPFRNL